MRLSLIAAVAENGVIGNRGGLPWRLSGDLQHFKAVTMGKPILMGRKTFESIGRPLPGRANIVVTRNPAFSPDDVEVSGDLERAIDRACSIARSTGVGEAVVIGGAAIYEATLGLADRLYLTEVHAEVEGDTRFPDFDRRQWREIARDRMPRGERDEHEHSFVTLERFNSA